MVAFRIDYMIQTDSTSQYLKDLSSSPQLLTWASMLIRGLVLILLLSYAGSVLGPIESTVFLLFISLIAFQGILDFGFIPSFVRVIAYLGKEDVAHKPLVVSGFDYAKTNMNEVMVIFEWVYCRLTILFLVLLVTIGTASLIVPISRLTDPDVGWLSWGLNIGGSLFLFSSTRYSAILTGLNKIALLKKLEIIANGPILILLGVGNYLEASYISMVLILNMGYLALYILVRRQVFLLLALERKPKDSPINRKLLTVIFQSAWRSGFGVLMTMGTITGSGLIVAQLASAADSASYLTAQRLIVALGGYCYVPFQVIIPQISTLYASGSGLQLIEIARKAKKQVLWLVMLSGLGVLLVVKVVLPYLSYSFRFVTTDIWLAMIMYALVERAGATNVQLQSVCNKIRWHIANGGAGTIMLCIMPFSYKVYGVLGMPLSFLFGFLFFYLPYSIYLVFKEFDTFNFEIEIYLVLIPIMIMGILVFLF